MSKSCKEKFEKKRKGVEKSLNFHMSYVTEKCSVNKGTY